MTETITFTHVETIEVPIPDVSHLVTEDDTPVDNLFSAKQQRLLVESLYASWQRAFLADANVAIYFALHERALVPDIFVSLDVQIAEDWYAKQNRSYFVWEFGKLPEIVVEIVSNTVGAEDTRKLETYARWGIPYYLIFDPSHQLSEDTLRAFRRNAAHYHPIDPPWFEELQIGARIWQGAYEGKEAKWLRWIDRDGNLLLTGVERAEQERARAEQERARAEQERARAERLAEKLRALGIEPE